MGPLLLLGLRLSGSRPGGGQLRITRGLILILLVLLSLMLASCAREISARHVSSAFAPIRRGRPWRLSRVQKRIWRTLAINLPYSSLERDFCRPLKKRGRWLGFLTGPGKLAADFVHEQGRKVGEVMTASPLTITEDTALAEIADLMKKSNIKRLPVMRGSTNPVFPGRQTVQVNTRGGA